MIVLWEKLLGFDAEKQEGVVFGEEPERVKALWTTST